MMKALAKMNLVLTTRAKTKIGTRQNEIPILKWREAVSMWGHVCVCV